jgi:glycosyltransferase involved in cell wall biosynthesis
MNVAILHYHLNRGGVTQVIANHLAALSATGVEGTPTRVAIFFGGRQKDWPAARIAALPQLEVTLHENPLLDYHTKGPADSGQLTEALLRGFRDTGLDPADTVVHIHNHALGKNVSLPGAIASLAKQGYGLLLQFHDFAEDFRPDNYSCLVSALTPSSPETLPELLYPQGRGIHYATLNARDRGLLRRAGVAADRLHALPNPVSEFGQLPERSAARQRLRDLFDISFDQRYILYPIRAIRRKNIGETLLWAAVCGPSIRIGVTLAPLNKTELPRYQSWQQLAAQLQLPIQLETGAEGRMTFQENLAAADSVITTSVAEGFGMVFLEAWLANLPLAGRDLPEITADFVQTGLQLPGLANSLQIPVDWIDRVEFTRDLWQIYCQVLTSYKRPLPSEEDFGRQAAAFWSEGRLDFASCSARLQASIVERVAGGAAARDELIQMNPTVYEAIVTDPRRLADLIDSNAQVVREQYSLASAGNRLRAVYGTVLDSARGELEPPANGSSILDAFLQLNRLQPIRIQ